MFSRRSKVQLFYLTIAVIFASCNGPFPSVSKIGPPDDHTQNIKGAMHRLGYKFPFKASSGCSDTKCHQPDLDGGVANVDGRITIAPSCFQCHPTLWSDETGDENMSNAINF